MKRTLHGLAVSAFFLTSTAAFDPTVFAKAFDPQDSTVEKAVKKAEAEGRKSARIIPWLAEYWESDNLDVTLRHNAVVVAKLIEKRNRVSADGNEIVNWNRFEIIEILSGQFPPSNHLNGVSGQEDLKKYFFLEKPGGKVKWRGIEVDGSDPAFPDFHHTKTYLLFVTFKFRKSGENPRLGRIALGPKGVFEVVDGEQIRPITSNPSRLSTDIAKRFNGSLEALRSYLTNTDGSRK